MNYHNTMNTNSSTVLFSWKEQVNKTSLTYCVRRITTLESSYIFAWEHWPDTREFITRILNCEIGGLDCHVITTEYRTRVHCIHKWHLFRNALGHAIYSGVSGQSVNTIPRFTRLMYYWRQALLCLYEHMSSHYNLNIDVQWVLFKYAIDLVTKRHRKHTTCLS